MNWTVMFPVELTNTFVLRNAETNLGCDTPLSFFSSSLKNDLRSPFSPELRVTSTHLGAISSPKDSLPVGSRLTWRCFCKRSWWDHRKGETDPVPGHEKSTPDLYGKTKKRGFIYKALKSHHCLLTLMSFQTSMMLV